MHFSNEEAKKKSQDKISKNLSEIELSSVNIKQEREKVNRLTEELLKEGVELIKVSEKLSEVGSFLHAENNEKQSVSSASNLFKEPVSIRKDHFPFDPQDYITGSYRVSDFSQTKTHNKVDLEPLIIETLGSRKGRSKSSKIDQNHSMASGLSKKKKRRSTLPLLPMVVFILVFISILLILDYYNNYIFPFVNTKEVINNLSNYF